MARYIFTSSSKNRGGVYILDSASGEVERILDGSTRGITLGPDGAYYVVSGYRNPEEGNSTIHRLDPRTWASEKVAEYALGDCHDLRWIDGHFYLLASLGNQIVRLDAEGQEVDRMQIVEDDRDICHLNCITELNGELYCSIFTLSPGERAEKRLTGAWHTEGKILKLDYERRSFEIWHDSLCQPHNLVYHEGAMYFVESHTSSVARVDIATRKKKVLAQYTGFVRGLTFGPGEVAVGVCPYYKDDRKRLKPLPFYRQWLEHTFPFSGLLVLNARNWRVRKRVPIKRAEVYEFHLLPDGH